MNFDSAKEERKRNEVTVNKGSQIENESRESKKKRTVSDKAHGITVTDEQSECVLSPFVRCVRSALHGFPLFFVNTLQNS